MNMLYCCDMEIKDFSLDDRAELLSLYEDAGWTAYTKEKDALFRGIQNSLSVLAAYEDGRLVGLVRAVGDGFTVVWIQDILVLSIYRRRGIGSALIRALCDRYPHVRQIMLASDATEELSAFYAAAGFRQLGNLGMTAYMKM